MRVIWVGVLGLAGCTTILGFDSPSRGEVVDGGEAGALRCTGGDLGDIDLATAPTTVEIEVENPGLGSVGPLTVEVTGAGVTLKDHDCATLAPEGKCTVEVEVAPARVGALAATLELRAAAGDSSCPIGGTGSAEISVSADPRGVVVSDPGGIECGETCSGRFTSTPVLLEARAGVDAQFLGWEGDCGGTASSCELVLDGAANVAPKFCAYESLTPITVFDPAESINRTQVALDASGTWHVLWYEQTLERLFYTARPRGQETFSEPREVAGQATGAMVIVDKQGVLHMVSRRDETMVYGAFDPARDAGFSQETIIADLTLELDLAVSDDGFVHVVFPSLGDVAVATRSPAGEWATQSVVSAGPGGRFPSIVVEPDGDLQITYFTENAPRGEDLIEHATGRRSTSQPPTWEFTVQTVQKDLQMGKHTALARSPDGTLHAVYRDERLDELRYARLRPGGTWNHERVASSACCADTEIVADNSGGLHIAYVDDGTGQVSYAYRPPEGVAFQIKPAEVTSGGIGFPIGLTSGPDGVGLTYNNASRLRLAQRLCLP